MEAAVCYIVGGNQLVNIKIIGENGRFGSGGLLGKQFPYQA